MITRVNNFNYRSFKNYTGPIDFPFKQKNIFFGYNGKGKSSLAVGIINEYIKGLNGNQDNYRFFNKDYIKNQLLLNDDMEIKGIIANFGKTNVELEKEIQQKELLIKNLEPLEEKSSGINNNIINEVENIFNRKKGKSSIKKKTSKDAEELLELYKKDLYSAFKLVNSKDELRNIKDALVYEKELEELKEMSIISIITLTNEEIIELDRIMRKEYSKNEIPSVQILNWLKTGLHIHKQEDSNKCKFCGTNINLSTIESKINEYLNDKKQQDLLILDNIFSKINSLYESKNIIKENKQLFSQYLGEKVNEYYDIILNIVEGLENISFKIQNKISNFDRAYEIDLTFIKENMDGINNNLNAIRKMKKEKEYELNNKINKVNSLIKGSIALEITESKFIEEELKELNKYREIINETKEYNLKLNNEINKLKKSKSTTSDFAFFLNELLNYLNIDLVLDINNDNYIIKHKREEIKLSINDISEGESNLLALLFFYYELFEDREQKQLKSNIQLIIIDDPISSVDNIHKIYILELIKKILELKEPQVFIFTHIWEDFCDISYGKKDNVDSKGNETPYRFYEVRKDINGSKLVKIKTNETPYMHDFNEVYNFSKNSTIDDFDDCITYHYPNVMRKVLEHFMEFKVSNSSPTRGNENNVKIALCGSCNVSREDDIQIPVLLDTCNIMSHKTIRNPSQILASAKYLMRKIKEVDKNHFSKMTNN